MTYATRQDLEQRYGTDELEQRESVLLPNAVATALADADALIDGYLANQYSLPLSPVPASLVKIAAAVARYQLLGDAATDHARSDYTDALGWLKDVSLGRVKLQAVVPVPGNAPASTVLMVSGASVFGRPGRP